MPSTIPCLGEETRPRPVRARDFSGDLGQRRIVGTGVLETVLRHSDGLHTATPFADKTRPWLEAEAWSRADAASGPQRLCQRLQLAKCRLAETAVFDFLKSVSNAEDQQIAADPRGILMI